jgi:hypothetical protein
MSKIEDYRLLYRGSISNRGSGIRGSKINLSDLSKKKTEKGWEVQFNYI